MSDGNRSHPAAPHPEPPLPDAACAWFLDLDGTLLEIAETPDSVACDPALTELLQRLAAASAGALALVSGRPIPAIDRLLAPLRLAVAGQHGAERRSATGHLRPGDPDPSGLKALGQAIRTWSAPHSGLLLEEKGLTLAVHFRLAPALQVDLEHYLRQLLDGCEGYRLEAGKKVFEIKPTATDKGTAVTEFMAEAPFRGRRPVFVGDDSTDEDAFAAVERMGGVTVKVGDGSTLARWRLPDVASVRAWIGDWLRHSAESSPQ